MIWSACVTIRLCWVLCRHPSFPVCVFCSLLSIPTYRKHRVRSEEYCPWEWCRKICIFFKPSELHGRLHYHLTFLTKMRMIHTIDALMFTPPCMIDLPLKLASGRLSQFLKHRLCHLCSQDVVDSDAHLLHECPLYNFIEKSSLHYLRL